MSEKSFFTYPQEVSDDFEKLFEDKEGYDVVIYAGEELKEVHAHSVVLRARSQYFRKIDWTEKKDGKFILKRPNISPKFFELIIRFIYCGKIDLKELEGLDIPKLLIIIDEFNIQTLITCVQSYSLEHQIEFLQQNPTEVLEVICQHQGLTDLWNFCLDKICESPESLFNSDKFTGLRPPSVESLLKRDDLLLDEIVIWDSLIKWCLAQNPSIQQNVKEWNKDEIAIMEKTIHNFVPLVRFNNISSEDFLSKVYPYRDLLPEDLFNSILTFHLAPKKKLDVDIQQPLRQAVKDASSEQKVDELKSSEQEETDELKSNELKSSEQETDEQKSIEQKSLTEESKDPPEVPPKRGGSVTRGIESKGPKRTSVKKARDFISTIAHGKK